MNALDILKEVNGKDYNLKDNDYIKDAEELILLLIKDNKILLRELIK